MVKTINTQVMPSTDSIEELARFWDLHDLTDFEDALEEISEAIFVRRKATAVTIRLQSHEVHALRQIARSKGVKDYTLLRKWVLERLQESSSTVRPPNTGLQPTRRQKRRRAAEP